MLTYYINITHNVYNLEYVEAVNWQAALTLSPYHSYESVRMIEYEILPATTHSTWIFHVFSNNHDCPTRSAAM